MRVLRVCGVLPKKEEKPKPERILRNTKGIRKPSFRKCTQFISFPGFCTAGPSEKKR